MQVMLRLSDDIARRLKSAIPARKRSAYVEKLLRAALPPEDKDAWLARVVEEVEAEIDGSPALQAEYALWDRTSGDGLDELPPFDGSDLHPEFRSR